MGNKRVEIVEVGNGWVVTQSDGGSYFERDIDVIMTRIVEWLTEAKEFTEKEQE